MKLKSLFLIVDEKFNGKRTMRQNMGNCCSDDCLKDMEHRPRRDGESQPAREPVRSVSLDFGTSRDGRQGVTVKDKVVTVAGEKGDALLLKQRILRALDIPCDTPVRALVFT